MYLITVYIPEDHTEKVKKAMFDAGAGAYKNYDSCSWETEGYGQFRPLKGSKPFIGSENTIERVKEIKVEIICQEHLIQRVIEKIKITHPYEEPAYSIIKIITYGDLHEKTDHFETC